MTASWTTACCASNRPSSDLVRSIGDIERRLAVIERAVAASGIGDAERMPLLPDLLPFPPLLPLPSFPLLARDDLVTMLSFIGRTFVALGGAYLLRALTDAAVVPLPLGTALGLAYAMAWLVMSDRAAAAGHRTSAAFHGLVATIIAFPLLWESVTRFQLLTPNAAAIGVTLVTALTLAAALRQRSQVLAWIGGSRGSRDVARARGPRPVSCCPLPWSPSRSASRRSGSDTARTGCCCDGPRRWSPT